MERASNRPLITGCLVVGLVLATACHRPDNQDQESKVLNGFDLSRCAVDSGLIAKTNLSRTGMSPLDLPAMLDPGSVDRLNSEGRGKFLVASDRVVGVVLDGESRAYPLRLLRWHEVVNDEIQGRPIAVTYSGPSDSVVVFDRRLGEESIVEFAASGLLYNSNLLLWDRGEGLSLWSQLSAVAISGPAAGIELRVVRSEVIPWGDWIDRHPETKILAPDPGFAKRYRRDPYHSYFGSDVLRFPVAPVPDLEGLQLKDRVVSVDTGRQRALFALPDIAADRRVDSGEFRATVGDVPVWIRYSTDPPALAVEPFDAGRALDTRFSCWFAWHAMNPEDEPTLPETASADAG